LFFIKIIVSCRTNPLKNSYRQLLGMVKLCKVPIYNAFQHTIFGIYSIILSSCLFNRVKFCGNFTISDRSRLIMPREAWRRIPGYEKLS
jgi:hypothetical protein